jgi:diguanylate cyclase (GGDEF)-like protein
MEDIYFENYNKIEGLKDSRSQNFPHNLENENSMAIAEELAEIGYWEWNTSTDELYWSDGIFHILGITAKEAKMTTAMLCSFTHHTDRTRLLELIHNTLLNKSKYQTEYRINCPRGERTVRESAKVITDKTGHIKMIGVIQDVTDTNAVRKAQVRLGNVIQASPYLIATISPKGQLLYINDAGKKLIHLSENETLVSINVLQFLQKNEFRKWKSHFSKPTRALYPLTLDCMIKSDSKQLIPVHITIIGHQDKDGFIEYFSVIARDVSEEKRLEREIVYQATHDTLTGLPNRSTLMKLLKQWVQKPDISAMRSATLFIDLNNFKRINDSLGHTVGDRVLIEIANRLKNCVRKSDFVARWGGDEFIVIIRVTVDIGIVSRAVEHMIQAIEQPILIDSDEYLITPSIGISLCPKDGTNAEELIKNADMAMYHAKRETGRKYEFYTSCLTEKELEQLTVRNDLHKGLLRDELEVYLQPLIETKTRKLVGAEALIRWNHPKRGLVPPERFIPIAEETGLITEIDSLVIQKVCEKLRKWTNVYKSKFHIAVNISPKQFDNDRLFQIIEQGAKSISSELLEIEITESAIMKNERNTVEKLKWLRSLGIRLALDDFGTGYSSLNHLRLFSTDTIKIDQAFVNEIVTKPEVAAITQSLILLAHSLSMKVVAEGVETEEQFDLLHQFGCDIVQGFLFSKPLPIATFEEKYLSL